MRLEHIVFRFWKIFSCWIPISQNFIIMLSLLCIIINYFWCILFFQVSNDVSIWVWIIWISFNNNQRSAKACTIFDQNTESKQIFLMIYPTIRYYAYKMKNYTYKTMLNEFLFGTQVDKTYSIFWSNFASVQQYFSPSVKSFKKNT